MIIKVLYQENKFLAEIEIASGIDQIYPFKKTAVIMKIIFTWKRKHYLQYCVNKFASLTLSIKQYHF